MYSSITETPAEREGDREEKGQLQDKDTKLMYTKIFWLYDIRIFRLYSQDCIVCLFLCCFGPKHHCSVHIDNDINIETPFIG